MPIAAPLAADNFIADKRLAAIAAQLKSEVSKLQAPSFFFDLWDTSGRGFIGRGVFLKALISLNIVATREECDALFDVWDTDHSGGIDCAELCRAIGATAVEHTGVSSSYAPSHADTDGLHVGTPSVPAERADDVAQPEPSAAVCAGPAAASGKPVAATDPGLSHARGMASARLQRATLRSPRASHSASNYAKAKGEVSLPPEIHVALTKLDKRLKKALRTQDVKLLRSAWLLQQPVGYHLPRRQELESCQRKLEAMGKPCTPFLSVDEAVALIERGVRGIGVLSHCWLSPGDCDPHGARFCTVQRALADLGHIEGLFWDQASLPQPPRTDAETVQFVRAINIMGDLYASAIGTTVLQLTEIPPRPQEFDGALCVFLLQGSGAHQNPQTALEEALSTYGTIANLKLTGPLYETHGIGIVRFTTHEAALAARRADPIAGVCVGFDLLYNERSYDGRVGEARHDGDTGRGWVRHRSGSILRPLHRELLFPVCAAESPCACDWSRHLVTPPQCCFEAGVSGEIIARLEAYPAMRKALAALPPKLLKISSNAPPMGVDLSTEQLDTRVQMVSSRIERAVFTSGKDAKMVPALYKEYVTRLTDVLQSTLAVAGATRYKVHESKSLQLPPLASADPVARLIDELIGATPPLCIMPGQLLLQRVPRGESGEMHMAFGEVDASSQRVSLTLAGGTAELSWDACSQVVLPWHPPAEGFMAVLKHEVEMLQRLGAQAQELSEAAHAPAHEEQLQLLPSQAEALVAAVQEFRTIIVSFTATAEVRLQSLREAVKAAKKALVEKRRELRENESNEPIEYQANARALEPSKLARLLEPEMILVRSAVAELHVQPEALAAKALHASGAIGARSYAAGQQLTVRKGDGDWADIEVNASDSSVCTINGSRHILHPWNHAPRELPRAAFEVLLKWYREALELRHSHILDPLSGRRLDVLEQCVPLDVTGAELAPVKNAHDLSALLREQHAARFEGGVLVRPIAFLLTASPAAGKTTLLSQVVVLSLKGELVPIHVKVQVLQRQLANEVAERVNTMTPVRARHTAEKAALEEEHAKEQKELADRYRDHYNQATKEARAAKQQEDEFVSLTWRVKAKRMRKDGREQGQELKNEALARALQERLRALEKVKRLRVQQDAQELEEFSAEEWQAFEVRDLCADHFIMSDGYRFEPVVELHLDQELQTKLSKEMQTLRNQHTEELRRLAEQHSLEVQKVMMQPQFIFLHKWNWIDAHLWLEHGEERPSLYRMLRQTMMARRALLLLDGLDEGGTARYEIEKHVAEVLAPQGHVVLVTSRPVGVDEALFVAFYRLSLAPLTDAQQAAALEGRLGSAEGAQALLGYVQEKMAPDKDTGLRVTANPLMLSMVASVYELRCGVGMPTTLAELYAIASDVMLGRDSAGSGELRRLLQAVFFAAHAAQQREIEDWQLDEAAIALEKPALAEEIRLRVMREAPFQPGEGRAKLGQVVQVLAGKHARGTETGVIKTDLGSHYEVTFTDGTGSDWLRRDQLRTSGMDKTVFLMRAMRSIAKDMLCEACMELPVATRVALTEIRRRVADDTLPLLSLLEADPLRVQSSHLSFQEFFACRELCEGRKLSGSQPWQWSAWWANAATLGADMGDQFALGLLQAANVEGGELDLSHGQLGGDRQTVVSVVASLMMALTTLKLNSNGLDAKAAKVLADALARTSTLKELNLSNNEQIRQEGCMAIASALGAHAPFNVSLTKLDLSSVGLDATAGKALMQALEANSTLSELNLSGNKQLGEEGINAIGCAICNNKWCLVTLHIRDAGVNAAAGKMLAGHLASMLRTAVQSSLTELDLRDNAGLTNAYQLLSEAVKGRKFTLHLQEGFSSPLTFLKL